MDDDYCRECSGNGDDYYMDENGEWVMACDECVLNDLNWDDGYWVGDDSGDI